MINLELLSQLGYGEVTHVGDVVDLYNMDCLMFKCNVTRESGRGDGKTITTSTAFHIALEVLANKCRLKALEWGYEIVELSYTIKVYRNSFEVYSLETETDKPYDLERFFNLCQWILDNKD